MKTILFKYPWLKWPAVLGHAAMAAGLLISIQVSATTVATLGGGPYQGSPNYYGYEDGNTKDVAQFHTPIGLALDESGEYLYVADRDNNAIREVDLLGGNTYTFTTNLINQPVGVAVDSADNVFVLNRGKGTNGTVLEFDPFGDVVATNATSLTNAAGIALDSVDDIYVTASNQLFRITAPGVVATVATITNAGASLAGVVVMHNGQIAVCDAGRNGICTIDPSSGMVTNITGFNGAGDHFGPKTVSQFLQPYGLAEVGNGSLVVADYGNNRVKVVNSLGTVTNLYGVDSNYWVTGPGTYPGWYDGTVVYGPPSQNYDIEGSVEARLPAGVVVDGNGNGYVTEDYYHIIREVTGGLTPPLPWAPAAPTILTVTTNYGQVSLTWSTVAGATSYNVKRSQSSGTETTIASATSTSYTDTSVSNGTTYYYVVSAVNAGGESPNSAEVSATPPLPAVTSPQIGYVDFPATSTPIAYTSVFHPVSSLVLNNDVLIVIESEYGALTYYTYGNTPPSGSTNTIPDPTSADNSAPPGYQDGLSPSQASAYAVAQTLPDLTIKAISEKSDGSPNSSVVSARFQFVTANPQIVGNNAAQFTVNDITANAQMWYTTDGTDPTNDGSGTSMGPISSNATLSLQIPSGTNLTFKIRGFKANYQPSSIVSNVFTAANFMANTISFGFASGEASSAFVGSPGQTFYAPVTLTTLSNPVMYSLQFNMTVTNAGTNAGPSITPGAFGFQSMLMEPIPGTTPVLYQSIPPLMFSAYAVNPPPPSQIITYDGLPFVNLTTVNTNLNLLGVGWLERYTQTNLYNTLSQTLITYSIAHDDLFPNSQDPNGVIVGGYQFVIPGAATNGQTYQIQIGRPSATSDGIGAPGSDVYIATPTNGSLYAGAINAIKIVTVGQLKYLVGDAYPFRWFNAGDFGDTNLDNADVEQVFEAAIYQLNSPAFQAPGSDFFDAMDSCGGFGVNNGSGIYTNAGPLTVAQENQLFSANDSTINQIAFGDGNLDVCDVYVTFRRSLDPSLGWFDRFWLNGQRVAETVSNVTPQMEMQIQSMSGAQSQTQSLSPATNAPEVNFAATDIQGSAGQVVQIPVTAQIFGAYPLRVLMLNLTVDPLDGSPSLTTPVSFSPNPALGSPTLTDSTGNNNYAAAWLDSTNSGLTSNVTLGTLTVTIPNNAVSLSAYAVHFDHASASPNGLASFPKQTLTGLVTLSSRTNSYYNDGIPDSWRLRWFGTIYNLLSVSNACPSGDGVDNWEKYVAGVDPNTPNDFPSLNPKMPIPTGATAAIHWPTVSGKQYVILRSSSLFPGSWTAISTNTGTGMDMEFDDTSTTQARFYRVQILQ
ncbi:MAG: chitobiase/beta-hexosaminidase C-terminal domain-containing protein [Verrucomicrobiia bacterium]